MNKSLKPYSIFFRRDNTISTSKSLGVYSLFVLFTGIVFGAAWADEVLYLNRPNVGLLQHWGYLTYSVVSPLALVLTLLAARETLRLLVSLDKFSQLTPLPRSIRSYRIIAIRSLKMRGNSRYFFAFLVIIGMICSVVNIIQTTDPRPVYGNDTFDSAYHPLSFIAAKSYIFLTWTLLYPFSAYILIHVGFGIPLMLRKMMRESAIKIEIFHADNCGGMSVFGKLNFIAMVIDLLIFLFLYALYNTHSNSTYLTATVPLFLMSAAFIVQSFLGVYHVHKAVSEERTAILTKINKSLEKKINKSLEKKKTNKSLESKLSCLDENFELQYGLLEVRRHALQLRTYPYTPNVERIVNFLRFAPSLIALLRLVTI